MLGSLFVGLLIYSMTLHVQSASAAAGQIFKMRTGGGGSTYYVGRCFRVNFYAQTDSMDVNSADLVVPYWSRTAIPVVQAWPLPFSQTASSRTIRVPAT